MCSCLCGLGIRPVAKTRRTSTVAVQAIRGRGVKPVNLAVIAIPQRAFLSGPRASLPDAAYLQPPRPRPSHPPRGRSRPDESRSYTEITSEEASFESFEMVMAAKGGSENESGGRETEDEHEGESESEFEAESEAEAEAQAEPAGREGENGLEEQSDRAQQHEHGTSEEDASESDG